jgi:23S rRNA U2552 (ribose-2'-O)-methylase RlmE/FtsJ
MVHDLKKLYGEYACLAGAEISFEVTTLLQRLCESKHPKLIIDLGSGWSSFVLRIIAPTTTIWSVDTDGMWLQKTINFCNTHNVPDDGRFVMLERFEKELPKLNGVADIVVHDIGRTPTRVEKLPMALDLVKIDGTIILDDMHKGTLCEETIKILQKRPEFVVSDNKGIILNMQTTQAQNLFDRFAWTATRGF